MTTDPVKEVYVIIRRNFPNGMVMQQTILLNDLTWFADLAPLDQLEVAIDRMFEQKEPPK